MSQPGPAGCTVTTRDRQHSQSGCGVARLRGEPGQRLGLWRFPGRLGFFVKSLGVQEYPFQFRAEQMAAVLSRVVFLFPCFGPAFPTSPILFAITHFPIYCFWWGGG